MKFALVVSYDGSLYCGWQRQASEHSGSRPSLQEVLEGALKKLMQTKVSAVASGRTDAGVHAVGQVVHFSLPDSQSRAKWSDDKLRLGLNGVLPSDFRVLEVREVSASFHAQRSAKKKQYSYYFQQGICELPHLKPFSWWIRKDLDLKSMNRGLRFLIGEHDFVAFRASGAHEGSTVRKIFKAEVKVVPVRFPALADPKRSFHFVKLTVVGTGFLKQMVRGIAGTALQIGEGKRSPETFQEILETRKRSLVGPTAPPRALWLERVWY